MIKLLSGNDLASVVAVAEQSVLIAAPYIKEREAAWLCDRLRPGLAVTTLTSITAEAISSAALDVAALRRLSAASPQARLIALHSLHAKVFVADDKAAIVTSGNLTSSALDHNIEYGVMLYDDDLVPTIRSDMLSFAKLGSEVPQSALCEIGRMELELREIRAKAVKEGLPAARRRLTEAMQQAHPVFVGAQVGNRTKYAVFGDAIQFILAKGPMPTTAIHEQVKTLLPDLCDDSMPLIVNGQPYGTAWKRDVRHAQLGLKRKGILALDKESGLWSLVQSCLSHAPTPGRTPGTPW